MEFSFDFQGSSARIPDPDMKPLKILKAIRTFQGVVKYSTHMQAQQLTASTRSRYEKLVGKKVIKKCRFKHLKSTCQRSKDVDNDSRMVGHPWSSSPVDTVTQCLKDGGTNRSVWAKHSEAECIQHRAAYPVWSLHLLLLTLQIYTIIVNYHGNYNKVSPVRL